MTGHSLRRSHRFGFTLVELLVVIGIIALLISILLPALKRAKESANSVKCMAQERQIMTAYLMYAAEMKGAMPIAPSINEFYPGPAGKGMIASMMYYMSNTAPGGMGVIRYDAGSFWPYLVAGANKGVTPSPATEQQAADSMVHAVMNCPSDEIDQFRAVFLGGIMIAPSRVRNFSYSWNSHVRLDQSSYGAPIHAPGDPAKDWVPKTSQIKSPSHKILLIEELAPNDGMAWIMLNDPDDEPVFRHNGNGNYGFADGHVASINPREMGFKTVSGLQHATITDMKKCRYYFKLNMDQ